MKSKLTALFLSLLMVISYLPSSMITSYALPDESAETTQEQTNPVLILDKEFDVDEVFIYKIIDGSEYEKDAFGLISYSDSLKEEISEEYLEVDKFYDKILELFKDTDKLKDLDKESDSETFEVEKEKINEQSLDLYEDIKDYLDESKQLQFNKKHELNDLEEGVYFILADKYYPQLINVTDSDKEINIVLEENKNVKEEVKEEKTIEDSITPEAQLPENKEKIKEENKEEKKENNTKASNKKNEPSRIAPSDTPDLATNVQFNKFDLTLTGGTGEFQTINGQQVYVVPKNNNDTYASDNQKLEWKLEYALSATGSYPAESIEIRIPRYYANKVNYDNTESLDTSYSVIPSIPAYPSYNTSGFAYKYDSDTKEYILTNVVELPGGSSGFFEFSFEETRYTYNYKDETLQIPLKATINVQTGDEGLKTLNSDEINWMFDTDAKAYNINELLSNKYDTWQDSWGDAPEDADQYFYVSYVFEGAIHDSKQRYTVKIENSGWDDDFVYGYIKYQNPVNTDSSTGIKYSSLDTPTYGHSTTNYYVNSSTYKSNYPDSNIQYFDGNSMEDGVVVYGNGSYYYNTYYTGVVLARYPKSIQNPEGYDVTNTITMTVHPQNGNDEDTTVTYTRTDRLKNINWERPPGNYDLDKYYNNDTIYGLNSLVAGSNTTQIKYTSRFIGSNYEKTVLPGNSLDDPNSYGKVPIHYEFIDDMLFLSGENTLLGYGDYEFENISVGPITLSDYVADDATGSYISQTLNASDSRYHDFAENGNLICWGKYQDGWHKLATLGLNSSNQVIWIIEDDTLVESQGSAVSFNSNYTYVEPPNLKLVDGTNCLGYKLEVNSAIYQISIGSLSSYSILSRHNLVRLFGSDRVKTWAESQPTEGGYLYNLNTLNVTDSQGNQLALEGDIEYSSSDASDINQIKPAINAKDTEDYGRELFHDSVKTNIKWISITSGGSKTHSSGTNDTLKEVYRLPYTVYGSGEFIYGLPNSLIVTNGTLNDDAYEYLVNNGYITDTNLDYVFYDLLPKGMILDESTLVVRKTKEKYDDSTATGSWGNEFSSAHEDVSSDKYEYEIISNYKNSGRDLLKVTIHERPGLYVNQNRAMRRFMLKFTGVYSWDSLFDYGTTLTNLVGMEWSATSLVNGKPDNADYSSFSSEEKDLMSNLDPNSDNPNFRYGKDSYTISAGVSGTSGLYKRVKGSSGDFEKSSMVSPQSTYQYKIRYAAESGTRCSELVFYDSLENYTPDNFNGERWRGKLQDIDISQPQSKGANPKIYYSRVENLNIENNQDLTNRNIWIPADEWGDDLSTVKAFAIDCTTKSNGEPFVLGEKESLAIIVNMISDVPNPNELFENNTKAYNNIYAYNKVEAVGTNQTTEELIHQNYTQIGILVPTTKFIGQKRWLDENDSTRPESIIIELLRNGTPYREQSITAQNNWKFEFNDLLKQDNNLQDYTYSVREKNTPTNYTAEIENDLSYYNGVSITFGNQFATESGYDYVNIYYKDENDNIKQLKGQGSNAGKWEGSQTSSYSLAGKTLNVPSKDIYIRWHSDSSTVDYGFDVISIDLIHIDDSTSIQSSAATLPTNNIIEVSETLPATSHPYTNSEEKLWHYIAGSGNFSLITNKQSEKSISGQKIWSDNSETTRPSSITVNLLQNGEQYQSKQVTATDNWRYSFTGIPVFDENNNLYHYTISEESVNGYTTRYSNGTDTVETPTEGYNDIENIWNPRVITITKQWLNSKGGDDTDFRPENIKVHLVRKQNVVQKFINLFRSDPVIDNQNTLENEYLTDDSKWVKDGDTWTYTFSIPSNDYEWEVYEEPIEYYTESNLIANPANVNENSVTITNDFEPQIEIKGEKIWSGNDENYRPESITVNLLRNNQIINTKTVSANDEWKYSFGYLPIYDNLGNEYTYSLSENSLDDYISTIDDILIGYSSYAITFGDRFATESTSYDWVSIYYVDEDNNLKLLTGQGSNNGKWGGSQTSSNSLAGKTIYVPSNVFYVYWRSDTSNVAYGFDVVNIEPSAIPNNITITSNSITSLPINESNAELITSDNLPATAHDYGNNAAKLWKFDSPSAANGFNITNTLNKQSINGTKTWVGDSSENRPGSITVNLYQDGRKIDSQEVTADNNWSYAFTNVPIYKSDGSTKYEYYVEEEPVENYFTNYDKSHAGVRVTFGNDLSITNSNAFMSILYKNSEGTWTRLIGQGNSSTGQWNSSNISNLKGKTIEIPSLEFYITWHGLNTNQKWDVTNIEVCDDISVQSETTETYSTADDIKRAYANATEVEINNNNLPVAPYNSNYEVLYHFNGTNDYKSVNLVNTYNLKNISGSKTWIGDTASNRPENITVNLYQDGRKIAETTTDASKNWQYIFKNVPIYHNDQVTEYEYYVTENPVENYYTPDPIVGTAITFGDNFNTQNNYDYLKILYLDENNNLKWLIGQGTNTSGDAKGLFYGGAGAPCPKGKTIYVPSNKVYLYWQTNGSGTNYGFDIVSMTESEIPSDISYTSEDTILPEDTPIEVTETSLPATTHNYGNNEHKLWYYERDLTSLDVTNVYNLKTIEGTKTWINDEANNRPESITVNLYQDDVKIAETTTDASKDWKYSFENMPIYKDNGKTEYEYYVTEEPVENYYNVPPRSNTAITFGDNFNTYNYNDYLSIYYTDEEGNIKQLTGQGSATSGSYIGRWYNVPTSTTSLAGKTIYVPGNEFYIYWKTNATFNQYGFDVTNIQSVEKIGSNIEITYVDSTLPTQNTPIEVVDENTYPKTDHNYNNNETKIWHYKGIGNGKSLDLVNEYNLFNVEGTVTWYGEDGDLSHRPETVTINLYQNGELYRTQELPIDSTYLQEFVFNDVPKKDSNGREYHYEAHQNNIDYYRTGNNSDLHIYNECSKKDIKGYKIWVDDTPENRPESIKVILYDDQDNVIAEKIVTAEDQIRDNCWQYIFPDIDLYYDNGDMKNFHVREEIDTQEYSTGYIPNYWYKYSDEAQALLNCSPEDIYTYQVNYPATLDNWYNSWDDYLFDNNIQLSSYQWNNMTEEEHTLFNNWWPNYINSILTFDENDLYGYSDDYIPNYHSEGRNVTNMSIINVYKVKHIKGVKHWEDEGSQYQRPDSVTIGLYKDGEKIDEQVITAEGNWKYEFLNLPEVKPDGTPYNYTIKEEPIENYITEYNDGNLTEGVELTFELPIIEKKAATKASAPTSSWYQNNVYNNFSEKYGLVTVFKDGDTWYKMTLEESDYIPTPYIPIDDNPAERAASSSTPILNNSSTITFIVPSNEFYVIPVFTWGNFNNSGGGGIFTKLGISGIKAIGEDESVPRLKSYRKVTLSETDKTKLNYVRESSRVEFEAYYYIDTFNYHMYNQHECGILFEKLGSSFDINEEVDNVLELKSMSLPYEFNEYTTNKTETYTYTDSQTGEEVTEEEVYERWVHNVGIHYKEQIGLTNYPLDATVDYSGYKVWNNNEQDEDVPDSPPYGSGPVAKSAKDKLTVKSADRVTQPDSVTVILLQDGQQYATQTIGEDTNWKFEFTDLPKYDPTDHHAYEYSIKEKSVKGYQSIIKDNEDKNGHQVVLSSDILMDLSNTLYVLCHYNGNWYVCQGIPDAWNFADINNKLKLYIPGDDFKIFVRSSTYSQNEISDRIQDAINNGQNPENYIKIDSVKAIDIPYTINEYDGYLSYRTMNGWSYYWDQINLDNLPLPEYNTINIGDGSVNTITLAEVLEGYDDTNQDDQYNEFYNLYQYTSNNTEGIIIENTYYEGSFKIKKVDEQGRILPGCEFSLYYADGSTWTKLEDDPTAVQISDANGIVSFENIPYGDYLLYETKPANGYRTPSAPWKVSINTNGSATVWDENGKVVPIQGSDKEYDMSNGVRVTYNVDTDMPYNYLVIVAKNEETDSAVIYTLRGNLSDTYSKKSIDIPTKDFYIMFMNDSGGSSTGRSTKSISSSDLFSNSKMEVHYPYGFKVEDIKPIRTSWNKIYNDRNYRLYYDSSDDSVTWDQFFERSADMVDIIECTDYPESKHYREFMEYVDKDMNTAWHYDASGIVANPEEFDNDALFEGTIITFGDNNHASTFQYVNPTYDGQYFEPGQEPSDYYLNGERYYRDPYIMFEYEGEYYVIELSNNPEDLNNFSMKIPSNNIWLCVSGIYRNEVVELRGSTVPSDGSYSYDLGNEIIDVQSIAKTTMTKSDVENALNMSIETIPKQYESEFTPEFELTSGPQEIHWMTDVLGDNDAQSNYYYNAFYHYQNDASGLLPIYEIANELTRTETILVNTEDDPIPGGVLQIIDKEGHIVDSWETTDVNHITWGLTEGEEYTIHQVSTPYPYIVAEDDTFTVLIGETTYVKVINDKAKNVVISKTVSGNGSNPDDIFNYHLVISGGHPNVTHTVQISNGNNTTVTTDANGNATLDFTLKHNETATVVGVFKDTNISVTESGNNYIASYKIDNNSRVINESANVDLSASATMVNDDISIAYENTITLVVPTSAYLRLKDMLPYILMGFCLLGMIIIYRKNRTKKLNLTK